MRLSKSLSGQMIESESTLTCSLLVVLIIFHSSLPSEAVPARGVDITILLLFPL